MVSTDIGLQPLPRAPQYAAATWGPYYNTMHPPAMVHWNVIWKGVPVWMDRAATRWRQRQVLRAKYEAAHGIYPNDWPTKHPQVVLEGISACLGCHWIDGGDPHGHAKL